jgi:hypothetical protein
MGWPLLHPAAGPSRRRGDPRGERDAPLRDPPPAPVRQVRSGSGPQRLLQPVQPGQEEHHARPEASRGHRRRQAPLRRQRRGGRELRGRRDGPHGARLRDAAHAPPGRRDDRALRVRGERSRSRQGLLRSRAGSAVRLLVGHRLPRPPADARRGVVRRPDRRSARRGRRACRPAPSCPDRARPVHRSLAMGDDHGRAAGGDRPADDERDAPCARRQP